MPKYSLVVTTGFERDLKKTRKDFQIKVIEALEELSVNPFSKGSSLNVKKLAGFKRGQYRLRIGDYRVTYDIRGKDILLYAVKHRKDIYRK